MAWVSVPGSNGIWGEYDNAATIEDTYSRAPGIILNGIRDYERNDGTKLLTYIRTRKAGSTLESGELSKNYFDAR